MQYGTVGEWLGGIGTIALFSWTLWVTRRERIELRNEGRLERQHEELKMAGRVNCWVQRLTPDLLGRSGLSSHTTGGAWVAVLQNGADYPVHEWSAEVIAEPPGRKFTFDDVHAGPLPPYNAPQIMPLANLSASDVPQFEVVFTYTDLLNVKWKRDASGLSRE